MVPYRPYMVTCLARVLPRYQGGRVCERRAGGQPGGEGSKGGAGKEIGCMVPYGGIIGPASADKSEGVPIYYL